MELKILKAEEKDLQEILSLQKQCYLSEATLYKDFSIAPLMQTIESINEEYKNGMIFLKGITNEKIIASVRGTIKDNTAFIGKLIVDENFQNKKIGQTMMNEIEKRLNNCTRYELFTGHKSEKNIYLYKKLGYKEFKRQTINDKLEFIFMEKIV